MPAVTSHYVWRSIHLPSTVSRNAEKQGHKAEKELGAILGKPKYFELEIKSTNAELFLFKLSNES